MFLIAGYIVLRVLLHFSDSKKGSKFGLKQNGTKEQSKENGFQKMSEVKKLE